MSELTDSTKQILEQNGFMDIEVASRDTGGTTYLDIYADPPGELDVVNVRERLKEMYFAFDYENVHKEKLVKEREDYFVFSARVCKPKGV